MDVNLRLIKYAFLRPNIKIFVNGAEHVLCYSIDGVKDLTKSPFGPHRGSPARKRCSRHVYVYYTFYNHVIQL